MYRQRKQFDLALADFNQAIELDANDPRAYHNRGLIYQAQGQHTQAIDDFSQGHLARARPRPSRSTRAASPISPPTTTAPRSTISTRS